MSLSAECLVQVSTLQTRISAPFCNKRLLMLLPCQEALVPCQKGLLEGGRADLALTTSVVPPSPKPPLSPVLLFNVRTRRDDL